MTFMAWSLVPSASYQSSQERFFSRRNASWLARTRRE